MECPMNLLFPIFRRRFTVFHIDPSRSSDVLKAILGENFAGKIPVQSSGVGNARAIAYTFYASKLDKIGLRYTSPKSPSTTRTANSTIMRLKYLSIQRVTVGPK